jgi:hypothetical protein
MIMLKTMRNEIKVILATPTTYSTHPYAFIGRRFTRPLRRRNRKHHTAGLTPSVDPQPKVLSG